MGLSLVKVGSKNAVRNHVRHFLLTGLAALSFTACQDRSAASEVQAGHAESRLGSAGSAAAIAGATKLTEDSLSSSTLTTQFAVRDDGSQWGPVSAGRKAADIVVCWARSTLYSRAVDGTPLPVSPGVAQLKRWVTEAVSHSWGRFANIYFFHTGFGSTWQTCTDEGEANSIVVGFGQSNFADRGTLARTTHSTSTRVLIDMHLLERDQVQQAAFALFGQALKFLSVTETTAPAPTPQMVMDAQTLYGLKASGMLIEYLGRCAADTATGSNVGYLYPWPCYENLAETWRPKRVTSTAGLTYSTLANANGRCLLPFSAPGDALTVGGCTNPAPIEFANQQWKAFGDLCVSATSSEPGATLELANCSTTSGAARWDFDFLAPKRIRLAGSTSCLADVPSSASAGDELVLVACGDITTAPEFLTTGQLSFGNDRCAVVSGNAATVGSKLVLGSCTSSATGSKFHISGRLSSNGLCSTLNWETPFGVVAFASSATCVATDSTPLAADPLEWDYYW